MKTRTILRSMLAMAIALPMSLYAQTDVNREKYPDYSDKTNPDWSLMQHTHMQKSAATNSLLYPTLTDRATIRLKKPRAI